MGPTWGSPGSCRPQMGPILAPWTLLSGSMMAKQWCYWRLLRLQVPSDRRSLDIESTFLHRILVILVELEIKKIQGEREREHSKRDMQQGRYNRMAYTRICSNRPRGWKMSIKRRVNIHTDGPPGQQPCRNTEGIGLTDEGSPSLYKICCTF